MDSISGYYRIFNGNYKSLFSYIGYFVLFGGIMIGAAQPSSAGNELVSHPQEHASCNKVLCASIVSYCLIQDKCSCHPAKNCSCCADCAVCLGDYYRHCCDCVGMRKGSNYSASTTTVMSTVSVLNDPEPTLFKSLTNRPMPTLRCTVLRFPVLEETVAHHHRHLGAQNRKDSASHQNSNTPISERPASEYWNDVQLVLRQNYDVEDQQAMCTAVYFDQCMPLDRCVWSCERMGASSARWFHNGCCECAGSTCLNYGNMHPKCTECLQ